MRPNNEPRRRTRIAAQAAASVVALILAAAPTAAQDAPTCSFRSPAAELDDRASPPDSSSLELADGTVKVCYGSPKVRGREIFGGLVPFGSPWRLGANEPTTLHTTVPLSVDGVEVDPGSYSLYAVPGQEEWKLVVNSATDRWGIPINDEVRSRDVGSVSATPEALDETVESMTIRLDTTDGGAQLVVSWAKTRVSVPLEPVDDGETADGAY